MISISDPTTKQPQQNALLRLFFSFTGACAAGRRSHLRLGVGILPVLLRPIFILDGKPGAAMQAAKAHHTLFLDPDRPARLHFDGLDRAFFRAQAAADAAILHMEMRGAAHAAVIERLGDPRAEKYRIICRLLFRPFGRLCFALV